MKFIRRMVLPLLICIPVLALGVLTIEPLPVALTSAWQSARLAAAQERYADAAALYRKILEYQPERMELWETIGELASRAGQDAVAVEAFRQAELSGRISIDGRFNLASAYQNLGEVNLACQTWRQLAEQPGLSADEYAGLVASLRKHADFAGALAAAKAWLTNFPGDSRAAYALGLLISFLDPGQALEILLPVSAAEGVEAEKSLRLLPGLETAAASQLTEYGLVVIGQRLLEIRETDLAEQAFLRATSLNPAYAEAWAMLSEAQQQLGQDGWEALEQARRLSPESDIVRVELVLYYRRHKQIEQALTVLKALAEDHPGEARWLVEIGGALAEKGDLIAAMGSYQRAAELEPGNAEVWRAMAAFAAENGFDAQSYSIPAALKALELDPDNPRSLDLMGWILLIEGDLDRADQFLQLALEKDAGDPRALLHLAQVYLEMNRLSLAYKPLSQAAAQSEEPSIALQASRLLEKYFPNQP
jgi:tetratricopeptide (TPR) repeat protein